MSEQDIIKTKYCFFKTLKQITFLGAVFIVSAITPSFASTEGNYTGAKPSLAQIDANWRAMYGAPVHDAILVFNKMSGGTTGDVTKDSLCIMRFGMAGSTTATMKNLIKYTQWQGVSGWGVSSAYRISPDGSKIALQNGAAVSVCDTNGTNLKQISPVQLNKDQLSLSWDDSAGIRRIVYSAGLVIVRTVVNADNTKGKTDTLWSHAWGKDPSLGNAASVYTSVNKVGHYLCFDMPVGVNLPVIVNLATQTSKNPSSGGDGCQARLCADTMGTISYHEQTHLTGATVWRWATNAKLGSVPCPNGQTSNCSDCGSNMFYWCDSDTNYMVQTGDNDAGASPGCYTKAFIRKGKFSSSKMTYLGDYFAFPALWINPNIATNTINNRAGSIPDTRISIKCTAAELTIVDFNGDAIDNAVLAKVNGAVVAKGQNIKTGHCRFAVSSLPVGMYLLSWQKAKSVSARFITIAR